MTAAICGIHSASAVTVSNITVRDYTGNTNEAPYSVSGPSWRWSTPGGAPAGQGAEDNETEASYAINLGTQRAQIWDLEAFAIAPAGELGANAQLIMIGGFDFAAGYGGYAPGDLFIKIGGPAGFTPTAPSTQVPNGGNYDYNFAVRLSKAVSGAVDVVDLNAASLMNTIAFDGLGSNPWTWASGQDSLGATIASYHAGLTADEVATQFGIAGLLGDNGSNPSGLPVSDLHNVVVVDLGFLGNVAANVPVEFSYTMECGNDMLKGSYSGGFTLVPDGGFTLGLLGLGLGGMALAGRRRA